MLPGIEIGIVNLAYIVGMLVLSMGTIPAILYFGTARHKTDSDSEKPSES